MVDKEQRIEDQGFERPFDESPINTPDGWEYRGIHNVGGHVYARIWRHKNETMELLYNMQDSRVAIIGGKYDPEQEQYVGDIDDVIDYEQFLDDNEDSIPQEDFVEQDLQLLAKQLMQRNP